MATLVSIRTLFLLFGLYGVIGAQGKEHKLITPTFCLSLSGMCGAGAGEKSRSYHYHLSQINDSGVLLVQGQKRSLDSAHFAGLKKAIVDHVLNLTEDRYGTGRDSADFTGELSVSALDRATIVKVTTALRIGVISDTAMTGLLTLLMKQVADSLQLPAFECKAQGHPVPVSPPPTGGAGGVFGN